MTSGTPLHINGRTGGDPGPAITTSARILVRQPFDSSRKSFTRSVVFQNMEAPGGADLLLKLGQFGAAADYLTLRPGSTLVLDVVITEFSVAASAGAVQYEALLVVAS